MFIQWTLSLFPHIVVDASSPITDQFRVTLTRPEGAEPTSDKMLAHASIDMLLDDEERAIIEKYDDVFEKYKLFCNGRWLGMQVLQDAQDMMYLQHVVYKIRPRVIIETGTYKGGLTYFFASLFDITNNDEGRIVSIDRNHPDSIWGADWFCPVCPDCGKPYETDAWKRRVTFLQGTSDNDKIYKKALEIVEENADKGPIMVNLDAAHEYEPCFLEMALYAPMVTVGSYLVVQDAKLDRLWKKPAVRAAIDRFMAVLPGEFVIDVDMAFYAYTQHVYLRRVKRTISYGHFFTSHTPDGERETEEL